MFDVFSRRLTDIKRAITVMAASFRPNAPGSSPNPPGFFGKPIEERPFRRLPPANALLNGRQRRLAELGPRGFVPGELQPFQQALVVDGLPPGHRPEDALLFAGLESGPGARLKMAENMVYRVWNPRRTRLSSRASRADLKRDRRRLKKGLPGLESKLVFPVPNSRNELVNYHDRAPCFGTGFMNGCMYV